MRVGAVTFGMACLIACEAPPSIPDAGAEETFWDPPAYATEGAVLDEAHQLIDAEAGGTLLLPAAGNVPEGRLVIPAGALREDTEITVRLREGGEFREDGAVTYELLPDGLRFEVPVTLTLGYRQAWVDENAIDEASVVVGVSSPLSIEQHSTTSIEPLERDPENNTVTVAAEHFSHWSVVCPRWAYHHGRSPRLMWTADRQVRRHELAADGTLNVVVIHGWGSCFEAFALAATDCPLSRSYPSGEPETEGTPFGARLAAAFWPRPIRVAYFDYPSGEGIHDNAGHLATLLRSARAPGANVVLVGHSMGGLLARSTIEHWRVQESALVTLGTPHQGANGARLYDLAESRSLGACTAGRSGRGLGDLTPGSEFLVRLNPPHSSRHRYYVAWTPDDGLWCGGPSVVPDDSEQGTTALTAPSRAQVDFLRGGRRRCDREAHSWIYAPPDDTDVQLRIDSSDSWSSGGAELVPEQIAEWLCGCERNCCATGRVCGVDGYCVGFGITLASDPHDAGPPPTMDAGVGATDAGRDTGYDAGGAPMMDAGAPAVCGQRVDDPCCPGDCCSNGLACLFGACRCPDGDGDGHTDSECFGDDCDDGDGTVYPGAPELCDGLDNDCDWMADERLTRSCTTSCSTPGTQTCLDGAWQSCRSESCGGGTEACNGIDDDGNGAVDEMWAQPSGWRRPCTVPCGSSVLVGLETTSDCLTFGACTPLPENDGSGCHSTADVDCDGLIDCADPDCTSSRTCAACGL